MAQLAFVWPRSFGGAGALLPLDDLIDATAGLGVEGWDDFFARDLAVGADGKIYGVPWTTDTFALIYNKDLLAAAGVDEFPTELGRPARGEPGRSTSKHRQGRLGLPGRQLRHADDLVLPELYWWSKGPA